MVDAPPLSVRLWQENADLVEACLNHPFVRGLADGTLPSEFFARYVAQDVYYLEAFFRAVAFAAGRCTGRHDVAVTMHRLMGGVLDEMAMHAEAADRLGVDTTNVTPYPSTTAYVDLLLSTASAGDLGETFVVMTPCMRLYAFLGRALTDLNSERHPYRDWIETYSGAEMEALAVELELLLDDFAADTSENHLLYRRAMGLELAFFSAAFSGPDTT